MSAIVNHSFYSFELSTVKFFHKIIWDQDNHKRKYFQWKKKLIFPKECVKNKCLLGYWWEEHANILALLTDLKITVSPQLTSMDQSFENRNINFS